MIKQELFKLAEQYGTVTANGTIAFTDVELKAFVNSLMPADAHGYMVCDDAEPLKAGDKVMVVFPNVDDPLGNYCFNSTLHAWAKDRMTFVIACTEQITEGDVSVTYYEYLDPSGVSYSFIREWLRKVD